MLFSLLMFFKKMCKSTKKNPSDKIKSPAKFCFPCGATTNIY